MKHIPESSEVKHALTCGCVAAMLTFASPAPAQNATDAGQPLLFEARGAFVALVVIDLEVSLRWYESNLGLHLVRRSRSPRVAAENVALGGHGIFVELIHFDNAKTKAPELTDTTWSAGFTKMGFIVDKHDFDSLARHFQNHGATLVGGIIQDKELHVRTFLVTDNSGNLLQFLVREAGAHPGNG